ncbi:hypothetical protein Tco_1227246 [Tanacetum coccineum]
MVVLESCPKHNMVAYLEKSDGNAEFHEIIDFLTRSSIHNALTVSSVVSTTFIEQFWMSANFKIINNVRYITAKVAGKPCVSLKHQYEVIFFCDVDGIFSLPNQAIFDLMNVPVPLEHFPVNALTSKVFSFMVKKGKHFSGKVTPLFSNMLVQPTEDEGEQSERPSEPQPTPSPPHPSEVHVEPQSDPSPRPSPTTHIPDSIPEDSGGNHGGQSSSDKSLSGNEGDMTLQSVYDLCISLCTQVTDQAKEIKHLKAQIKKLKKKAKPVITHHRAWMKSGRKSAKAEPSVHKDPLFDELADDTLDYMDTENAQDVGRTRNVVYEEEESVEDVVSTDKEKVSTDRSKVSTDRSRVSTDKQKDSTIDMMKYLLINKLKERAEKKFKQLAHDEEIARKMQEDWEREEERKRLAEEEATNAALIQEFDDIKARMEADRLLALRLQEEEREQLLLEEESKFLHDTNQSSKKETLRPEDKTFEEIQALYEKVKRFDESFTVVGSTEDERKIKEMNEGAKRS